MEKYLQNLEIIVAENVLKPISVEDDISHPLITSYLEIFNAAVTGQYPQLLQHDMIGQIFSIDLSDETKKFDLEQIISENVDKFLSMEDQDEVLIRKFVVSTVAVGCLQMFLQENWVGPPSEFNPRCLFSLEALDPSFDDYIQNYLSIDGESVNLLSSNPIYLVIARILLLNCRHHLKNKTSDLWLIRCLWIHQSILDERSPTLKQHIVQLISDLEKEELFSAEGRNRSESIAIQFHVESCHICYFYYEPSLALQHMNQATELAHLSISLSSALGKRTRFQQSDVSQLFLKVERIGDDLTENEHPASIQQLEKLPKNVLLDDESVLEEIQFKDADRIFPTSLSAVEQCVVLAHCHHHRRTHEGQGHVVKEESMAYINCVLSQPLNWSVQTTALLMRARWETEGSRRLNRSIGQLEELVNQYKRKTVGGSSRLPLVYSVALPPRWTIEQEYGNLLVSVGAVSAALEIFLRVEMWEEVIKCYSALGHRNKAENLIREQLKVKESPCLWCYLGDVTHDPEYYVKAWELSNQRYGRAQRCLAYFHLRKLEFDKSLPFFEKTLEINPLQMSTWFSYGCACLSCSHFDKAAIGFRRCVNIDSDNFEAWNNLATAYIRANNKPRAFVTLQEAIKCDYENWRIWENYLVVSVDIGQFEETIRAYHRLLELRPKHTDVEVLTVLVKAIVEDLKDATGESAGRLKHKALELFGHVTSKLTNSADIWRLYAQLLSSGNSTNLSETDNERVLQYLQKAHRCNTVLVSDWEKNIDKCIELCKWSLELTTAYRRCLQGVTNDAQRTRLISSAKLAINGIIAKARQNHTDFTTNEIPAALKEHVDRLEEELGQLLEQRQVSVEPATS